MIGRKVLLISLLGVILESSMSAEDNKGKKQAGTVKPFPIEICEAETKRDFLGKCVGKRVKISGTIANSILKDPNLKYPDASSMGGYTNQRHIDTQWGQLGLISKKPIKCEETIEVNGILHISYLAGEYENFNSKSPYIQVLAFYCK
jgi:hypothetical protein